MISELFVVLLCFSYFVCKNTVDNPTFQSWVSTVGAAQISFATEKKFLRWVDFTVPAKVLDQAYQYDVQTYEEEIHLDWIALLAYAAAKTGGDFSRYQNKIMDNAVQQILDGEMDENELTQPKSYGYYYEAYQGVLGGLVGEYEVEREDPQTKEKTLKFAYGLKGFLPIAKGYPFTEYDDFGVSRSYGYKRKHLGHDMMGQVGTPIIAVESGYVEAIGWNQYGGWRLGIRSFDKKRYYYYAHLRKDVPFSKNLQEGSVVTAGDVIGYMGRTGYSLKENQNNIETSHLHFGLQIIFDESQKEGNNEIWISCYQLMKFLQKNQSPTRKDSENNEHVRVYQMKDPLVEEYKGKQLLNVD